LLLSTAGGFLDAFTWIAHGGVFANAQTGNVVLLGLFAALGDWAQAARHVPPIAAFVVGVLAAHQLRAVAERRGWPHIAPIGLAAEIAVIAVAALLPASAPDLPVVLAIAFVAALQASCFLKVEGFAYSSVVTTTNLRHMADGLFDAATPPRDPQALRQAWVFAAVATCFAIGAAAGAFTTTRLVNRALAVPIALLLLALLLCRARPTSALGRLGR
jgi:uncharacterized membrane protein YoaK (UPF0700 family)